MEILLVYKLPIFYIYYYFKLYLLIALKFYEL